MASLLYIFPHPDDECFGPAPAIARQRRHGHDVHLLTLTRGEATSQRERLGYSKEEMAETRHQEMQDVADALDLSSLTVWEYPDGQLAELDPLVLEDEIARQIHETEPDVVVTYPVHGVSGHPDHLVTHAVVKRVVCALRRDGVTYPKRLAFFTLPPAPDDASRPPHLQHSPLPLVDCVVSADDVDFSTARAALECYATYLPVIEKQKPLQTVADGVNFELFGESYEPPLSELVEKLETSNPSPLSSSI
ncbi:GlcNAc-PI de-N-acetylase [Salinibacter sp. 10B]|uniref:PIG-L deacetylase family protein n=1 Tax=Salinibacter sp. 10B TaxID=1923971 RepID=UPI000CF4C18B|nr:PIG-L family deacetylase [Salinibacter sp. 10B]PQJ33562.1 GlcNAc-PI de-N-acetylase [Salinibacter sp. 10B]